MKIEIRKYQDHNEYLFDVLGHDNLINKTDKYQALIIEDGKVQHKVQHIELGVTKQEARKKAQRWIDEQSH